MPATPIYLSPHYDDVGFSLGMTARNSGGGHLVNIFTRCNYTATKGLSSVDEVSRARDAEDSAFAARCKLTRHALGFAEATVLGFSPFDLTAIEQEVKGLEQPLTNLVQMLAAQVPEAEIYCPLAVGRHRNHVSVFLTVVKACEALRKKSRLFFYEDLPYAAQPAARNEALQRLAHYFPSSSLARHVCELAPSEFEEKMELVSLYRSQHHGAADARNFIPADPQSPFPQESFWEVLP